VIFSHVLYQLSYLGTPGESREWKGKPVYHPYSEPLAGVLKGTGSVAERTLIFPAHLFRRFGSPGICATLFATLATGISLLLRRTWQPQLPRMSDAWLRSHDLDFDRYDQWREY
jgi:hypothetical protein